MTMEEIKETKAYQESLEIIATAIKQGRPYVEFFLRDKDINFSTFILALRSDGYIAKYQGITSTRCIRIDF